MRVIAAWSTLESQMGSAFAVVLGASAEAGVAMYNSLTSNAAKNSAMRAAADIALSGKNHEMFSALVNIFNSLGSQRNDIAHGVWGYSPDLLDAVLLTKHSVLVQYTLEMEQFLDTTPEDGWTVPQPDRNKIQVYKAKDFSDLTKKMEDLSTALGLYRHLPSTKRPHVSDHVYDQLCSMPLIREELSRIRKKPKKPRKGKKQPRRK